MLISACKSCCPASSHYASAGPRAAPHLGDGKVVHEGGLAYVDGHIQLDAAARVQHEVVQEGLARAPAKPYQLACSGSAGVVDGLA